QTVKPRRLPTFAPSQFAVRVPGPKGRISKWRWIVVSRLPCLKLEIFPSSRCPLARSRRPQSTGPVCAGLLVLSCSLRFWVHHSSFLSVQQLADIPFCTTTIKLKLEQMSLSARRLTNAACRLRALPHQTYAPPDAVLNCHSREVLSL